MLRINGSSLGLSGLVLLIAAPAMAIDLPSEFSTLDKDADQNITFGEFSDYARTLKIGPTEAAQHFIKLSAGDATISEVEFAIAKDRQQALRNQPLAPMSEGVSDVRPANLTAMEPIEPDQILYEKTPNEEVAGEVIRNFEDDRERDGLIRFAHFSDKA